MASGSNPKSKANLAKGNRISKETARKMQEKSVEARKKNTDEQRNVAESVKQMLTDEKYQAFIMGIIDRGITSKVDAELLLAIMGQKPIDKQQIDMNANITYEDFLRGMRDEQRV